MKNKLLPIGTVVLIKGAKKKVFIIGFTGVSNGKKYDYIGFTYPEGFVSRDINILFNHDDIEKIYYTGYETLEEEKFKEILDEINENKKSE